VPDDIYNIEVLQGSWKRIEGRMGGKWERPWGSAAGGSSAEESCYRIKVNNSS
jgi:hypothetical protein